MIMIIYPAAIAIASSSTSTTAAFNGILHNSAEIGRAFMRWEKASAMPQIDCEIFSWGIMGAGESFRLQHALRKLPMKARYI